ncbi:MAG: ribbon-helix-helix domain-containing protein [Ruminococcus sp.]|nr:ribbon-helix-helix domain-containing protein [Ruminococcus sp.]
MVAAKGRPVSENPKDFMLRVRLDKKTLEQLDACCAANNLKRSEVVRKGIREQFDNLKK